MHRGEESRDPPRALCPHCELPRPPITLPRTPRPLGTIL